MTQGGFYETGRMNPKAVAIVVLLHGAALAALIMAKGDIIDRIPRTKTVVDFIDEKIPQEKLKPLPPLPHPQTAQTRLDTPKPDIPIPTQGPTVSGPPIPWTPPVPPGPVALAKIDPPVPPPAPRTVEPARAHANLSSYVSDADYPDAALRSEEQGATRFRLIVGTDGRVTGCTVVGSSGSSALDSATCRLMKSRARFTPARDSSGNPTTDSVASTIRWVLPDG
jgi:periplasmic protein TonB